MFKNSAKFNLTDFSVMLFTVVIALCYVFQHGTARDVVFEHILGCEFVYLSVRLICSIFPKTINYATLLFISGYSLFEAYKGLLQLLGERTSNHYLFACTGSFLNPGPYGGFLAVCIAVLGAYAVTTNRGMDKTRQTISALSACKAVLHGGRYGTFSADGRNGGRVHSKSGICKY